MEFYEKFNLLLSLTATKNVELADTLKLGKPYVSRMKKGERGMPTNLATVRAMSEFFASRCEDDYRRSALKEITSDPRMCAYVGERVLADIIFDWITGENKPQRSPAGRFLTSLELFSQNAGVTGEGGANANAVSERGISMYYDNDGRRQALRDFIAYVASLEEPCVIYLFTDELCDWLTEDLAFSRWLDSMLVALTAKGFTFERIQPPFANVEFTFSAINRWLPLYMLGAIKQYYYPWARDGLHRRTIFMVPTHIALYSNSLSGARETPVTAITRDRRVVDVCDGDYNAILKRCLPAMSSFASGSERLFVEAENVSAIEDTGIYKTNALSVNSLPAVVCERIRMLGTPYAKRMCESFEKRAGARENVLREHTIVDIMHLPDLKTVLSGKEPIPGTQALMDGALSYTPEEYKAHLKNILNLLETYPNYQAVFADDPQTDNLIMYVKGTDRALLVKCSPPFTVFDITERTMANAFCDYLHRVAESSMTAGSRRATMERLRHEINKLDAAMSTY